MNMIPRKNGIPTAASTATEPLSCLPARCWNLPEVPMFVFCLAEFIRTYVGAFRCELEMFFVIAKNSIVSKTWPYIRGLVIFVADELIAGCTYRPSRVNWCRVEVLCKTIH